MTFEKLLQEDGRLVYRTRGVSMEPMLRQNRDLVVIEVPSSRLKKYDVALYRRGTSYVLHRVIGVKSDHYLIRGDSAVLGVLTAFQRKGKKYSVTDRGYRCYVRFWDAIYPLRALRARCRGLAVEIARKLGLLPLLKRLLRRKNDR